MIKPLILKGFYFVNFMWKNVENLWNPAETITKTPKLSLILSGFKFFFSFSLYILFLFFIPVFFITI